MVIIEWSEIALDDLMEIHEYISKDSKMYAYRYINKLFTRVDQLETQPKSGRVVPEYNMDTIRELIEGNYRIVYKIIQHSVTVLRVCHAARLLK